MAYAILQKEMHPPEAARLQRAFAALPHLTKHDALSVGREAHGVLLRGLEAAQAEAVLAALLREEVAVEIVAEAHLPAIPPAKFIRRMDWCDGGMALEDPMRRSYVLRAADLMLVAAGRVRVQEFRRERNIWEEPGFHGPGVSRDTIGGVRSREQTREMPLLELLALGGAQRFSILADEMDFGLLGDRRTADAATNLALLVGELAAIAPHAGLNRGAWHLTRGADDWVRYPSRQSFFEELTWMMWRCGVAGARVSP